MTGAGLLLSVGRPSPAALRLLSGRFVVAAVPRAGGLRWRWRQRWGRRPVIAVAGAVGVGVGVAIGAAVPVALAAALVVGVLTEEVAAAVARRDAATAERQVLSAVEMLSAELAAGSREPAALRAAAAAGGVSADCLSKAAELAERGGDASTAFTGVFAGLAGAWRVRAHCGTPLADVVASVGEDLAARTERRRAFDAALAGPRASGAMLAALPLLGLGLGAAMGVHPLSFLLAPGRGSLILLFGVGLDVGGWCWIKVLVGRALR
jgi:tight adherence protein B